MDENNKNKQSFKRTSIAVFLISIIGSICNAIFQLVSAKYLSISKYGELTAVLTIIGVVSVFGSSFISLCAHFGTDYYLNHEKTIDDFAKYVEKMLLVVLTIILLSFATLYKSICIKFNISNNDLFCACVTSCLIVVTYTISGILQAKQKIVSSALVNNVYPFIKLIIVIIVFIFINKYSYALLSLLIGAFVSLCVARSLIKISKGKTNNSEICVKDINKYYIYMLIIQISICLLNSGDFLLVKRYFDVETVGQYSFAMTYGKIAMYAISPISFVLLPMVAKQKAMRKNSRDYLIKSVILSIVLCTLFVLVSKPLLVFINKLFYDNKYLYACSLIRPISMLMIPISIYNILFSYCSGEGSVKNIIISGTISIVMSIIVSYIYHSKIHTFIYLLCGINIVLVTYSLIKIISKHS